VTDRDPTLPVVDVVIDNFNYGRFLSDAIESALEQTHQPGKVIVVDDGSTDESRRLLEGYVGRVELVLQENRGQASALNAGFARVSGDAVIFLDADDVLRPEAATLVASSFAADDSVVKVQYRMEVIDEQGAPTGAFKPVSHLPLLDGDLRRAELVFPFDLPWLPTSGNAFRTRSLRRLFPIPEEEFATCPDWYLVHLVTLLGRVATRREVCACYRVHGQNRYEPRDQTLDLDHVRKAIVYAAATTRALEQLARELELGRTYETTLSVADLANRLVSRKLEPQLHPISTDRTGALLTNGIRAALRRFDVSWQLKVGYALWFAATALAPRVVARRLAEVWSFPGRRGASNRLVSRFHRWNPPTAEPRRRRSE
jgi:glycosyltransferase involved in cell wall biosynthesis